MTPNPAEFVKVPREEGRCSAGSFPNTEILFCAHRKHCAKSPSAKMPPCTDEHVMFIRPEQITQYIRLRMLA